MNPLRMNTTAYEYPQGWATPRPPPVGDKKNLGRPCAFLRASLMFIATLVGLEITSRLS